MARLAAPPPVPERQKALSTAAFWGLVLFYPGGIFYYLFIYPAKRKKLEEEFNEKKRIYDQQLPEWEKSWLCLDCGKKTVFD